MATALEATGAIGATEAARTEPKITDRLLEGWIVQDVRRGRALVASRDGGMFVVTTGASLPGLGRVRGDQAAGRPMGRRHRARDNYVRAVILWRYPRKFRASGDPSHAAQLQCLLRIPACAE